MKWLKEDDNFYDIPLKYQEAIDHYILTGQVKESYRICANRGILDKSLESTGSKFFKDKHVQALVRERKDELLTEQRMSPAEIIKGIEDIANGKVEDQFSSKTSVKDRHAALVTLGKINGVLDDRNVTNVAVGVQFINDL